MPKTKDPEVLEFEAALLRSAGQAVRGEYAAVHTHEQIAARKRGRPVGTVKADANVSTTIRFDAALKATGRGGQSRANDLLRADTIAGRL